MEIQIIIQKHFLKLFFILIIFTKKKFDFDFRLLYTVIALQ